MRTFLKISTAIGATFITAFAILLLVCLLANTVEAQSIKPAPTPPANWFGMATLNASVQSGPVWDLRGTGINYHKFQWSSLGTVSAGACKLQGAAAATMASPSDIIAAQTVTSSGGPTTITSSGAFNYVQITCSTPITGTGSVYVYYTGYNDAPTAAGAPASNVTVTSGQTADGSAPTGNAVRIAGVRNDNGQIKSVTVDSSGQVFALVSPNATFPIYGQPQTTTLDALTSTISATVTNSVNVKASAGNVYGFSIANGAATVCYAQFINSAGAGTLGTAVIFAIALPGSSTVNFAPGDKALSNFSTGIAVGIATTPNTNSACGTAGNVTTFYK